MTKHPNNSASTRGQEQFDEILAKLMRAIDSGGPLSEQEWLNRHPEFARELHEFFAKNDRMEKLVRPLRRAVAQPLHVRCPHCHNPIELLDQAGLSDISCPSCGSSFSLVADNTLSYDPSSKSFGQFELLDRVGVGQFGSVWKARDTKLDRTVAIKIPRNARMDSAETEMFLRDARAAAQLKHPSIVSVHEVGKQDDTVFIVSDFIQGATLKEWTQSKRLTPRESAELCVKVAKALHHAHEAGVIHRDLKPGNIMMDTSGEPHIVDFGLAKREAGEITMTMEGQILGTPAYMSPEQARGDGFKADRRADIYSLGVILFELLTGELPFRGDKQMLLVQILADDPPSPRKLNSGVPRDLETICLKCLNKEPAQRYECGLSLAHDLERFLFGEPIRARPVGRWEHGWRWCRRNRSIAGLLAVTATLLATIAAVTTGAYFREAKLRGNLEQSYGYVEHLEIRRGELNKALIKGREELDATEPELYETYLNLARSAWREDNIQLANHYLRQCPERRRNQDWQDLKNLCYPSVLTFDGQRCAAMSDDGELLASGGAGNSLRVWHVSTGQLLHTLEDHPGIVNAVAFSSDGKLLAVGSEHQVVIWNLATESVHHVFSGHTLPVSDVDFSPDGRHLASASHVTQIVNGRAKHTGEVILWDILKLQQKHVLTPGMRHVVFNHDGRYVASGGAVWDMVAAVDDAPPLVMTIPNASSARRPAFHPFKDQLAIADVWQPTVKLWDVKSKRLIQRLPTRIQASCLEYSSSGRRLAYTGGFSDPSDRPTLYRTEIWNLITDQRERTIPWHSRAVTQVLFSPSDQRLLTVDAERTQLWNVDPLHDPTEEILADIVRMDVGRLDWPQWGGSPSRINTPAGNNIPLDWDAGALNGSPGPGVPKNSTNIKWTAPLGSQTYANPVVANGRIFVGTNNGAGYLKRYPPVIDLGVMLCFEEHTGKFLWQHSNEKLATGRVHDWPQQGVCSTPVVDGNRLWYVSNRGEVVCLDTEGFHDGEDDGAARASLARIFDLKRTRKSENAFDSAIAELDEGKFPAALRIGCASRGVELPKEVAVSVDESGKKWVLTAKIGSADRRMSVSLSGPRLSVFQQITTEDHDEADVVWKFNMMTELGVSQHNMSNCSMLTVEGMLFVCTSNGTDETHMNIPAPDAPSFMAMDRDTGKVLWTDKSPGKNIMHAQWGSPSYGVFEGQPQVIFPGGDGWVYSFDPKGDGAGGSKLIWKFDGNPKESEWIKGGRGNRNNVIAFPAIYDGLVYVVMGQDPEHGEGEGMLWCIDPTKRMNGGDVSAELALDPSGNVMPHRRVRAVDAWIQLFQAEATSAHGLDENRVSEALLRQFAAHGVTLPEMLSVEKAEPAYYARHRQQWLVTTDDDLMRFRIREFSGHRRPNYIIVDRASGERAVANPDSAVVWNYSYCDQNGDGEIDFEEEFHRSLCIPVIKDDILYTADFSGLCHCLNAKTGEVYWTYDMLAQCWGSPLLVDDKVYIGDEDGDVLVFRHSPDPKVAMKAVEINGRTEFVPIQGRRQYDLLNEFNMGDSIYMTPIVANNVLYIATRSALYAIEEKHEPRRFATETD